MHLLNALSIRLLPLFARGKNDGLKSLRFPSLLIFYEKLKMKIVLSVKKLAIVFKYGLTMDDPLRLCIKII